MNLVTPVAISIVLKDGKVLFIRREGKTFSGLLSLPGGKIDFGETIEETALRELEEETGVRSRFVRHLATIPEHIIEDGNVSKHLMIQLCELEHVDDVSEREFEPVWVGIDELDSRKGEITPSDYLMIKEILLKGNHVSHFSVIEKSGPDYTQKEFREI